jgi:NADP-dependent 3-hydroxy acid dehydrogenase YdfG
MSSALGETALSVMGRVDILMNNAGVMLRGALEQIPIADWEWSFDINSSAWCVAYVRFCRTCSNGAAAISSTPGLSPG